MAPLAPSASNDSDYFGSEDPSFLEALKTVKLPGDLSQSSQRSNKTQPDNDAPALPCTQPNYYGVEDPPPSQPHLLTREERSHPSLKRPHNPDLAEDDIYGEAHFDGFGEYARRKRAKLQIQNAGNVEGVSGKEPQVFKGVAIFITGWTNPSLQELRALVVRHGGAFHAYLDKKSLVTHIITSSITPAKVREFKNMKVVRPEWLVESAKRGVLLPWQDYVFRPNQRSEAARGRQSLQQTLPLTLSSQAPLTTPAQENPKYTTDPKSRQEAAHVPHYAADKSNPNAQRVMQNPEWRSAHTSAAPDFIEGYYRNSRLHHLSTWKAELKHLLKDAQERAERGDGFSNNNDVGKVDAEDVAQAGVSMRGAEFVLRSPSKSGRDKGKAKAIPAGEERVIMHCDFDSFFVAAGLVKRPELKGKPVVVCHSQGGQGGASSTSEIASASYEARSFGIKNGMSLQQARKLCPNIITIPYEFEL